MTRQRPKTKARKRTTKPAPAAAPPATTHPSRQTVAAGFTDIAQALQQHERWLREGASPAEGCARHMDIQRREDQAGALVVQAHRAGYVELDGLAPLVAWLDGDGPHPDGWPACFEPCPVNVWNRVIPLLVAAHPATFATVGAWGGWHVQMDQGIKAETDAASVAHRRYADADALTQEVVACRLLAELIGGAGADNDAPTFTPTPHEENVLLAMAKTTRTVDQMWMAGKAHCSQATAQRLAGALEEAGMIHRETRNSGYGLTGRAWAWIKARHRI